MIKRFFYRLFLYGSFIISSGCSISDIGLSIVNGLASTGDYTVAQSISYGPSIDNRLDIYKPHTDTLSNNLTPSQKKLPVVVFFYGGCWGACGSLTKESYKFVAEAITEKNYITVITDYRLYPSVLFPEIIDDARLAVEWVKNNIDQYGGDPENIFLMGHSAGAQMAAMLVLDEQYLSKDTYDHIKGFVGLAGPYDFLPFTASYQRILFGPKEQYRASQPINFVSGSEPPLKLMHGLNDRIVKDKNAKKLSAKVREKGGEVETNYYDGVSHAGILAELAIPFRGRSRVRDDIVDFLDRNTTLAGFRKNRE